MFVFQGFKRKLFTHVGIAAGIIAILALFIFLLNHDINARVAKIEGFKKEVALRAQTIELLTGANSDLKRADALMLHMRNLLPNKDQLIDFPRELQRAAKNYAVDVGFSFGAESPASEKGPGIIKFTLTASGAYDNIVDFLKIIETHRYLISLDSVDVHRSSKEDYSLLTSGQIYTK